MTTVVVKEVRVQVNTQPTQVSVDVLSPYVTVRTEGTQGIQGIQGIQGPAGSNGAAGSNGTNGLNVLSGSGVPSSGLGVDGDTYINLANGFLYKKITGSWVYQYNITGATGATGPAGPQGEGYPDYSYFRPYQTKPHGVEDWWAGLHISATSYRDAALTAGRLYMMPFVVTKRVSARSVAVNVFTAATGASIVMAIYDSREGMPKSRMWSSGPISGTTTGLKTADAGVTLDPGEYFLACVYTSIGAGFRLFCTAVAGMTAILGHNQSVLAAPYTHIYTPSEPSSLPNDIELPNADMGTGVCPAVFLLLREA